MGISQRPGLWPIGCIHSVGWVFLSYVSSRISWFNERPSIRPLHLWRTPKIDGSLSLSECSTGFSGTKLVALNIRAYRFIHAGLTGGAGSLLRTTLHTKFPANREFGHLCRGNGKSDGDMMHHSSGVQRNSLLNTAGNSLSISGNLNHGTGNYQTRSGNPSFWTVLEVMTQNKPCLSHSFFPGTWVGQPGEQSPSCLPVT